VSKFSKYPRQIDLFFYGYFWIGAQRFEAPMNSKDMEVDMKWLNRLSTLFLIGISLLILFSSLELGIGSLRKPGAGFIPFVASILVLPLSLVVLIMGMKGSPPGQEKRPFVRWQNLTKMISLVVGLSGYVMFLKSLGYVIAAFLLMFLMFFIYNPKKWCTHIVAAVIVAAVSFCVFRTLGVELPAGIFHIGW
jgi:hypothetical protein